MKAMDVQKIQTKYLNRLLLEVDIQLQLVHPNIVQLFNAFYEERDNKFYMIMELADGGDMQDLLKKFKAEGRSLPEA